MCYPWQNGSCENCTSKVPSGQKLISRLGQLPITLIGMIARGHGDDRYV
jgi:hypothetical protein